MPERGEAVLISVILPAAGVGQRFRGAGRDAEASASKIEYLLDRRPVFLHAIDALRTRPEIGQVLMAVHPERVDEFRLRWGEVLADRGVRLVAGGTRERWETVSLALQQVDPESTHVAVHDAARPIVPADLLDRLIRAARRWPAVVPALPVSDTLKRVGDAAPATIADPAEDTDQADRIFAAIQEPPGHVSPQHRTIIETVPRADLVAVQTPQVFSRPLLERAYAALLQDPGDTRRITDDASLVEALGEPVVTVDGHGSNLKLTRPEDADLLTALIQQTSQRQAKRDAVADLFGDDED